MGYEDEPDLLAIRGSHLRSKRRHLVQPSNPYLSVGQIRGIVGDARETGLDHEPPATAYWCTGTIQPGTFLLIKTRGEPNSMAGTIRRKIHELEPQRSVYDLTPLTDHISDAYAENRLRMVLLAFFALPAIALASVGLYGDSWLAAGATWFGKQDWLGKSNAEDPPLEIVAPCAVDLPLLFEAISYPLSPPTSLNR